MKTYRCIIFDCDGVLVDSEQPTNIILLDLARENGLMMSNEDGIKHFHGSSLQQCMQIIEEYSGKKLPDNFISLFRKRTYDYYKTKLKPINGVHDFINSLGIEYCVASSGPLEKMDITLGATGLIEKFRNKIFSSYEINSWKPEPNILHAAKEMGYDINECMVIEDSVPGVIAAVRGGFKVYGYAAAGNAEELSDNGAEVFYSFEDLKKKLFSNNFYFA